MTRRSSKAAEAPEPHFFPESWAEFYRKRGICAESLARFRTIIFHHYLRHRRHFSWRDQISPYGVLVSEIMLQQTQTTRVAPVFERFMARFPTLQALARAPFAEVLGAWKGLGYNRRAKYLHQAAIRIVGEFDGDLPDRPEMLQTFSGIGSATAASICVFAFNQPLVFIETNIRTVFLHFFFPTQESIDDREVLPLIERTLDVVCPRDWYYALMDYGVLLKRLVGNAGRRSRHYQRQSPFAGSDRQIRGRILGILLERHAIEVDQLSTLLVEPADRVQRLVGALCTEGMLVTDGSVITLADTSH